jgi:hypothetical protein
MNAHERPRKLRPLSSESLLFRSNGIGGWVDGRSAEGVFLRKCERELTAQLGGATFTQKMLIRRLARSLLRLELLDKKAAEAFGPIMTRGRLAG